jgi:hypothetical protein
MTTVNRVSHDMAWMVQFRWKEGEKTPKNVIKEWHKLPNIQHSLRITFSVPTITYTLHPLSWKPHSMISM